MKFGVDLGRLNPARFVECTLAAERLGFESVWLPEHLVLTENMTRSPRTGEHHPPVPATTPVFDAFAYLCFLAGKTERIRLGTAVYNLGLRHPFVAARAVQTLDVVSQGRSEFGIGASWLEEEWVAAQLDFRTRGLRVDEAIDVCKRLWSESSVSHHGRFFEFEEVVFEPKCVQRPWPPILVGGESDVAMRRAARVGDGWIGMNHDLETATPLVKRMLETLDAQRRDPETFEICLMARGESIDIERWEAIGVTRMIVAPWARSAEAVEALDAFAGAVDLTGP